MVTLALKIGCIGSFNSFIPKNAAIGGDGRPKYMHEP